ncbi:hypothetical protein DRO34_05195 [Candidatus Bathyarchaeota archaeon]|nr:MAG: hypothetical protein DRO34_05195 [Candidatus Bathyarchaeota archaeon]
MHMRWLKSKRGISPILATLLLIVIAVAAIVVTYAWVMMYMGTTTTQAGVLLKIDNIWFDSVTNVTKINVRNAGDSDTKLVDVYVGTSSENMVRVTDDSNLGSGKPISGVSGGDNTVTITISWPNNFGDMWTEGTRYYFKVVPQHGEAVTASAVP